MYDGQQNKQGFVLFSKLLHPQNVRTIQLKSQNPFDYPIIDPQYLTEEQDVDVILDGKIYVIFTNNCMDYTLL